MKYAVFSVSIPEYEPREAVRQVKASGYDGIEWRVIDQDPAHAGGSFWSANKATVPLTGFEEQAPEVRKMTEDAGLEMPSLGTYMTCDDLEAADGAMRGARVLGVSQLRIRVPNYNGTDPFTPIWDKAKAEYRDIVDLAAKHDVKALLELHHRSIVPSASAAKLFLDGLDPDHVGVIHDAGNLVYEGYESHRLSLEQLGPYLAHVHVKNARWVPVGQAEDSTMEWKCEWAPVHQGVIDMRQLFGALHAIGYDGWVGLEDFSSERSTEDKLRENLAYLKGIESRLANSRA